MEFELKRSSNGKTLHHVLVVDDKSYDTVIAQHATTAAIVGLQPLWPMSDSDARGRPQYPVSWPVIPKESVRMFSGKIVRKREFKVSWHLIP